MQICRHGDVVHVRRQRWRIVDVRSYARCRELTLVGAGAANLGLERHFLEPFDVVEPLVRSRRLARACSLRWRSDCRRWLARSAVPGWLGAAGDAHIDLRLHQLEPAMAVVDGQACRLLLADGVGLGKTIQAGLVLAELVARGAASRALVLAPAGLRDQWRAELSSRFGLRVFVADAAAIRRRVCEIPVTVNPWSTAPVVIASVDYVKRAEVLPAVSDCRWDVVIVDEAHAVVGRTDRHAAASRLTSGALYVLLLSATPHSGDHQGFQQLCRLGERGDRLLVFRRSRRDVRIGAGRRVHRLPISMAPQERRMHRLLDAFSRAVRRHAGGSGREAWLALAVLHKRALSSPAALHRSVLRRLRTLDAGEPAGEGGQLTLPWVTGDGELTPEDAAPEWPSALRLDGSPRERRLLAQLAAAAADAAAEDSKLGALVRLLDRVREPAIVFTEYRDTLAQLQTGLERPSVLLHGGLSRADRGCAVDSFTRGESLLLLATDAAAEGLNLQHRCRIVINLELPWNPMRLEQRIGRVDRIGQTRRVHVFHLIASGTGEDRLLDRLRARVRRARVDLGAADPIDGTDELSVARFAIAGLDPQTSPEAPPPDESLEAADRGRLEPLASCEAARLGWARGLLALDRSRARTDDPRGPRLVRARHHRTRAALGNRLLALYRVGLDDGAGREIQSVIVPISLTLARPCRSRQDVAALLEAAEPEVLARVTEASASWRADLTSRHADFLAAAITRAERLVAATSSRRLRTFQADLFTRRAERERGRQDHAQDRLASEALERLTMLRLTAACAVRPPELLLVLTP